MLSAVCVSFVLTLVQAVAKVECDTQQRRNSQQLEWEAKQQEMDQKLEGAEAEIWAAIVDGDSC